MKYTEKYTVAQKSTHLYDVVKNDTGIQRWKAIKALQQMGDEYADIASKADLTVQAIKNWVYRNRDKYELKNNVDNAHTKGGKPPRKYDASSVDHHKLTLDEIDYIEYGELAPTLYVSDLDHIDWGNYYLGHTWDKPYLREMADGIWNDFKLMLQIGRHHGKTFTMIKLFTRWILEKRTKVICLTNKGMKDDIYESIVYALQSAKIRKDYGDVMVRWRGNKHDIWLTKEFREVQGVPMAGPNLVITSGGPDAKNIGKHAKGGWLHLEDVMQDVRVSEDAERRVRKWFDRTVKYIAGLTTKLTVTGTRKDIEDFYWYLEDKHHIKKLVMESLKVVNGRLPRIDEIEVDHDRWVVTDYPKDVGTYSILGCPEYPLGRLLYEFIYHYESAEAELNNNPLPLLGNYFSIDHWLEIEELPYRPNVRFYQAMDPAFGSSGSTTSSKTAILVCCIYQNRLIINDAYIGDASVDEKEKYIIEYFNEYDTAFTYIEDNFRQISSRYSVKSALLNLPGLELYYASNDKKERISALKYPFKKRQIVFYSNTPYLQKIKAEYLTFSMNDSATTIRTKYNALDTLAALYEKLKMRLSTHVDIVGKTWDSKR